MDIKLLTEITSWIKGTDITAFTYKKDGEDIVIKAKDASVQAFKSECSLVPVSSPAIGIFHNSEQGRSNILKEGQIVAEGDILGIIEMPSSVHPVKAPRGGALRVIAIEDGKPAQYGQPLFFIELSV
jgi:biotin carboxyl carrier protein